jgi:hypothetical protein
MRDLTVVTLRGCCHQTPNSSTCTAFAFAFAAHSLGAALLLLPSHPMEFRSRSELDPKSRATAQRLTLEQGRS